MTDTPDSTFEREYGWAFSLLFWPCLLLAVALYAAVSLAPKYFHYLALRQERYDNQVALVRLEQQVQYLGKVAAALEHDPQFKAELARIDFDAARPGEERIPVDPALALDARAQDELSEIPRAEPPWYMPLVEVAAQDRRIRRNALMTAAAIIVFAFALLHEGQIPRMFAAARRVRGGAARVWRVVRWCAARYERRAPAPPPLPAQDSFRPQPARRPQFLRRRDARAASEE